MFRAIAGGIVWLLVVAHPIKAANIFYRAGPGGDTRVYLLIIGEIQMGDEIKFRNVLLDAVRKGVVIDRVITYSPGGAVPAALKIGRYIRTMRLET